MIWSALQLALREIRRSLLRSSLTALGIIIGVSAVVTMVTLGNGATQAVSSSISSLGSNLLMIRVGQMGPGGPSVPARPFEVADVDAIREQVSSLRGVASLVSASVVAVYGAENWSTSVSGTSNEYFTITNAKLASGRTFTEAEERGGKAVCVLGETVREELFGQQNPIGSKIRLNTLTCQVIGLLQAKGQAFMGQDQDDAIIMPMRAVQRRLTGNQDVHSIQVSVADGADTEKVQDAIGILLRNRRRLAKNEDDDFTVIDAKELAKTLTGTTTILTMLVGAVAGVSLLVGGIGIMNIMLVSVTERTREIGVRLAIGALEGQVLLQFLVEAIVLSSVGGLVGIALATIASVVLSQLMGTPYAFGIGINLLAFLVSAGTGVIFGFFPARRAARLNPIEALRYE
jgi:putative ABC transport system permease protein